MDLEEENEVGQFNIIPHVIDNHKNLKKLFQVKFNQTLKSQLQLQLNLFNDSESKQLIYNYLNREEVRSYFLQEVKADPILSLFQKCLKQQKQASNVQKKYDEFLQVTKRKCKQQDEPLTLKKDYEKLYHDLKKCFIPNTSFTNNKRNREDTDQNDNSESEKVKGWALKLPQYLFKSKYQCQYCERCFFQKSGLISHQNSCAVKNTRGDSQSLATRHENTANLIEESTFNL